VREAGPFNSRELFETWYACNAFDYESNPIGSRDCGLQRAAWQAGVNAYAAHVALPAAQQPTETKR
jgi:hypothetical protein